MATSTSRWRRLQPGLTAPLLLAVALLADVGSRFVSYDHVAFRAWEALNRFGGTGLGGPFEPNARFVSDRAYGDLSSLGNYPALRQYHREAFTTDAFGLRNSTRAVNQAYGAVLFGTSFAAGSSLSDDETLSARLESLIGQPVYNAAGANLADEQRMVALIERLGMKAGTVIEEHMAASSVPHPALLQPTPAGPVRNELQARLGAYYGDLRIVHARVRGWLRDSPLKLTLFRGFKAIEDDTILPNVFSDQVVQAQLVNGDPILFSAKQVAPAPQKTPLDQALSYWQALASRLRGRGLNVLVVLVPSQYQVYGPLVAGAEPDDVDAEGVAYLAQLERGLCERGLPVVNLTETFRAAARAGLARHQYIYWRDDTHWNPNGVALAATEIAARLRMLAPLAAPD